MDAEEIVLKSYLSPGDVVMLTATLRDLHAAHPGKFRTGVETSCMYLWENNPHAFEVSPTDCNRVIEMHYPLVHESNQRPYHFLHGYTQYLEEQLGISIPVSRFSGDIHLSGKERTCPNPLGRPYWLIFAGGKFDYTVKWWNPEFYQTVTRSLPQLTFVQTGRIEHFHPALEGDNVVNRIGTINERELITWMYHADGVICPITFPMHLAAAVPLRPRQKVRGCVVIAGGREAPSWESYPTHQYLHTVGALDCCAHGGCWAARCTKLPDDEHKLNDNLCKYPVKLDSFPRNVRGFQNGELAVPKCMMMIEPKDVVRAVERYYDGGSLEVD